MLYKKAHAYSTRYVETFRGYHVPTTMTNPHKPTDDVELQSRLNFLHLNEAECQAIRRIEAYIVKAIPHAR